MDETRSQSWTALHQISVIDFFKHDKRPTFIVDSRNYDAGLRYPISITFINDSLRENEVLIGLIAEDRADASSIDELDRRTFSTWVRRLGSDSAASDFHYSGWAWTCTILANRWNVFVANALRKSCNCGAQNPKHVDSSESPFTAVSSTQTPITRLENDSADSPSRLDHHTILNGSRDPITPTMARDFSTTESCRDDACEDAPCTEALSKIESRDDSQTDSCMTPVSSAWSNIWSAKQSADLLTKISAFDSLGISITNLDGDIIFANNAWYKICGIPRKSANAEMWMSIFEPAEQSKIADVWKRIIRQQEVEPFQTPLKRRWNPPASANTGLSPQDFPVWIHVWAYADISPDGQTIGCCSVLTDISQQKWTERLGEQQLADSIKHNRMLEQLSKELAIASETRFRRISDAMPHGVFMCDEANNMLYGNDAYRELFSDLRDPTDLKPWWVNMPEDERAQGMEFWEKLKEEKVKVSFEMPFLKISASPDGPRFANERRYMMVSAYPELDETGRIKHITGCITDVSFLKNAERAQVVRADNAEESKRQLEKFIDMTSHEIRNPLSAIVHATEQVLATLQSYPNELTAAIVTDAIDMAETIIDCTNHSKRIVDDILVVSKLDSGLVSITPSVVRLVPAVKQALKMFQGEMSAAQISQTLTIDNSFDELKVDWVGLDISRVLQIFVNLITNAIKFTRPEHVRRIDVRLRASTEKPTNLPQYSEVQYLPVQSEPSIRYVDAITAGGTIVYIIISVMDTGCGISDAEQKTLFQRFAQAGSRTHVKYGGTGLGLYISRQLCEMQGGRIGLQSTPRKGSNFTFYVRACMASPPGAQDSGISAVSLRPSDQQARSALQKDINSADARNSTASKSLDQTILLVEDNLVNQKVVAKILKSAGFTIVVANHGLEALSRLRDSALFSGAPVSAPPISLILLDVEMPIMDGLTCIRQIRKMEQSGEFRCHIPVVATTANARQEQIDEAKEAGMDDVVTKPFHIDQLTHVMRQLCERYPT